MRFLSRISPYFLLFFIAICGGFTLTIIVLGGLEWRRMNLASIANEQLGITYALLTESYQESVVITSVNTTAKTIIAQVRSSTAGQFIPTILRYGDDLEVTRRDVIIQNGVIVGLTDPIPLTVSDLVAGTNGIANIHIDKSGEIQLRKIVIGVPLPRP